MQIPNFRATHNGLTTRSTAARLLCLPWRVWLKIIAAIPALAVTSGLNVPDPVVNWILSAIVLAWVSAYTVWHIK